MEIGITLPTNLPGVDGDAVWSWARQAEASGFSTLGMGERIGYEGYDWSVALSAAASVTSRIRLFSHIVILPLRSVGMAAKQTLSLQRLSGGRLSVGVGIGPRRVGLPPGLGALRGPGGPLRGPTGRAPSGLGRGAPRRGPADHRPRGRDPRAAQLIVGAFAPAAVARPPATPTG